MSIIKMLSLSEKRYIHNLIYVVKLASTKNEIMKKEIEHSTLSKILLQQRLWNSLMKKIDDVNK